MWNRTELILNPFVAFQKAFPDPSGSCFCEHLPALRRPAKMADGEEKIVSKEGVIKDGPGKYMTAQGSKKE